MYKCINNLAPAYLCYLFPPRTPNYYFHNAKKKLMLPKPRTDYLKRGFSYSGREVPIDGFLISTPTRQICKTVFENF